jgi:hypothetical protein
LAGAFVVWSKQSSIGGSTVGATEAPTAQEGDRKIGQRSDTNKDGQLSVCLYSEQPSASFQALNK